MRKVLFFAITPRVCSFAFLLSSTVQGKDLVALSIGDLE